jgi:hypothetical protein
LSLYPKLAAATVLPDKELYLRRTWRELVEHPRPRTGKLTCWCTGLYGLTEEEIGIVEERLDHE